MGFKSLAIVGILFAGQLAAACPGGSDVAIKQGDTLLATYNRANNTITLEENVSLEALQMQLKVGEKVVNSSIEGGVLNAPIPRGLNPSCGAVMQVTE